MSKHKTNKHRQAEVIAVDGNFLPMRSLPRRKAITAVAAGRAQVLDLATWAKLDLAEIAGRPFEVIVFPDAKAVPDAKLGLGRGNRAILRRDNWECQVLGCNKRGSTIDHMLPTSRGGKSSWVNCIAMCRPHNEKKGDKTIAEIGYVLKHPIRSPRYYLMERFHRLLKSA